MLTPVYLVDIFETGGHQYAVSNRLLTDSSAFSPPPT